MLISQHRLRDRCVSGSGFGPVPCKFSSAGVKQSGEQGDAPHALRAASARSWAVMPGARSTRSSFWSVPPGNDMTHTWGSSRVIRQLARSSRHLRPADQKQHVHSVGACEHDTLCLHHLIFLRDERARSPAYDCAADMRTRSSCVHVSVRMTKGTTRSKRLAAPRKADRRLWEGCGCAGDAVKGAQGAKDAPSRRCGHRRGVPSCSRRP